MGYNIKTIVLLLFTFLHSGVIAQTVNFEDGFEDGNFTNSPTWSGNIEAFTIIDDTPNFLLQLDASTSPAYLSTPSTNITGSWTFFIEFRGFEPSGSNQAEIFLMSDIADLNGSVNGYAVQVGESGDDVFKIVRYDNGTEATTVLTGTTVVQSSGTYTVRVNRDASGNWQMEVSDNYGGPFDTNITGTDNTHTSASYLGPRINFTSTRSDKFFFDFKIDLPPFDINQTSVSSNEIDIIFNREYKQSTVQTSDFSIDNGIGTPNSVTFKNSTTVQLDYGSTTFPSGEYTITINDVDDQNGITIAQNTTSNFLIYDTYAEGDIIINEFAYDYPTTISEEYIEIRNTSDKYLNLAGWEIADNNSNSGLGSDPIPIEPDSFLVISADTVELSSVFGDRAYHQSGFPALNNTSPDAVQLITNTGAKADSLTYNSTWGGIDLALERRSASTPSTYQENWGDSPNPDGGTPGTANEIAPDYTPPELIDLNIISTQTLQLVFDERLGQSGNYNITNNSTSINQTTADTVELSLGSALQDAQHYTLSIEGATDIFGNTITSIDTSFTFYNPSPVDSGDVAINEFMYDPPSGNTEYIELYNHSDKSLDLHDWTLSDNRETFEGTISNSQFILPPDSFVVIAPDNTIETEYPDIALIAMNSFPALNNGGDQIIIRDQNGSLLDSLQYNSNWGGNEIAIERRTIDVLGTYQSNWGDAPNGVGTPGTQNEIAKDNTAPSFDDVIAVDNNKIELTFSENITVESATNTQNYQLSPSIDIQLISVERTTVTLFLEQPLTDGEMYKVTVSNLSDIFGNSLSTSTRTFEYLQIDEAQTGQIVINEILYDPGSGNKADFIELYNTSDKNFDLTNWTVGDYSTKMTIEKTVQLEAGQYLVLTGNQNFATDIPDAVTISGFPALNNNMPDDVYIKNASGITIDSLHYHQHWGGNLGGTSLERKDPLAASNDPSNWQTSNSESGTSAGTQNTIFKKDTDGPEIIFSKTIPDGTFEVHFNEFIQLTDELAFYNGGQQLSVSAYDSTNANRIILKKSPAKTTNTDNIKIRAENLQDVKGNITSAVDIPVAQPIQNGDLVINEIMFNPLSDSDDNLPDQSEYIELRNTQDYAISLEGLFLHDEPDENGNTRNIQPVSSTAKWVLPQEHVLVHADEATDFEESLTATFFELDSPNLQSIMRADRSSLSLASSGDAIYIADSIGTTIDSVFYDESWHNPNIIDTRGITLERISPNGPSNDDSNWGSSITDKGGTPNSKNSIYQENTDITEGTGLSFEPNPFSPDDDGYEDNLFINYKLDQQDYLMKVRIYDRYGRYVRTLADGEQAGFEGQLIWDGRKDDNSRNRIGIYIVIFEAYDSASGSDKTFKETVVLARRLN
ncbi:lamin tail domain-containing protein [Fodinibius sp. Rm-B-1B1-1]|uniref:lamin tail domain-containing protein n=1 Tax=Fodinibius alkaliphilus TaxID=3140241 RepID=UPI003159A540